MGCSHIRSGQAFPYNEIQANQISLLKGCWKEKRTVHILFWILELQMRGWGPITDSNGREIGKSGWKSKQAKRLALGKNFAGEDLETSSVRGRVTEISQLKQALVFVIEVSIFCFSEFAKHFWLHEDVTEAPPKALREVHSSERPWSLESLAPWWVWFWVEAKKVKLGLRGCSACPPSAASTSFIKAFWRAAHSHVGARLGTSSLLKLSRVHVFLLPCYGPLHGVLCMSVDIKMHNLAFYLADT